MAKNTFSSPKHTPAEQVHKQQGQGASKSLKEKQSRRQNRQGVIGSFAENVRLQAFLLVFLALALYVPSIRYGYVLDDGLVMSQNTFVRQGIAGIPKILSQGSFAGNVEAATEDILSGGRYRPLSLIMFAVEWQLSGGSPVLSHSVNIVVHAFIVLIIFYMAQWLARWQRSLANNSAPILAHLMQGVLPTIFPFCVALLFAVHPVHVEVVANIKSRDELLSLLFSLIALAGFVRAILSEPYYFEPHQTQKHLQRRTDGARWQAVLSCIIAFVLALFSKENALTMLAVLPLTAWFLTAIAKSVTDDTIGSSRVESSRSKQFISVRHLVFMMIALFAVALVFLVVRTSIVGFVDDRVGSDIFSNPFWNAGTSERYGLILTVLLRYVVLMVFPWTLAHDYGYNTIPREGLWHWQPLMAIIVYGVAIAMSIVGFVFRSRLLKRQYVMLPIVAIMTEPVVVYGICWYLATLSIVSNIIVNIGGVMGERFLYMPSAGGCCVMAWLLLSLAKRFKSLSIKNDAAHYTLGLVVILIVSSLFALRSVVRLPAWESTIALLRADAESVPMNLKIRDRVAIALLTAASTEPDVLKRTRMVEEAYRHIQAALSINDTISPATYNALADYYSRYRQRADSAIICYERALRIKPNDRTTLCNLYNERATLALEHGLVDSALVSLKRALSYDSGLFSERTATMMSNIGVLYLQQLQLDSAEAFLRGALRIERISTPLRQGIEQALQQVLQGQSKNQEQITSSK
jgi:hypothetical protein